MLRIYRLNGKLFFIDRYVSPRKLSLYGLLYRRRAPTLEMERESSWEGAPQPSRQSYTFFLLYLLYTDRLILLHKYILRTLHCSLRTIHLYMLLRPSPFSSRARSIYSSVYTRSLLVKFFLRLPIKTTGVQPLDIVICCTDTAKHAPSYSL